jgi:hypothetical protein
MLKRQYPELTDFSPKNQDKAAWYLAKDDYKRNTGRDLLTDLQGRNFGKITKALNKTWTSLAGGKEEQGRGGVSETQKRYDNFLLQHTTPQKRPDGSLLASQPSSGGGQQGAGSVNINPVTIQNNTQNNTVAQRPATKATATSNDPSLVRNATRDIAHPVYAG